MTQGYEIFALWLVLSLACPALAGPNATALRLETQQAGMYALSFEDLQKAGLPADMDPQTLQMFRQGREIAILVQAAGTVFGPGNLCSRKIPENAAHCV